MKKIRIKDFIILDTINRECNKFEFGKKSNIIISEENHVGKSTLLTSMYYAMGANLKNFSSDWDYTNYIFQITWEFEDKEIKIKRHKGVITTIFNNKEEHFYNEKEFSVWFQNIVGLNIKLNQTQTKERKNAYMNALLTPFYIDQDNSWEELYKNNIGSLFMYKNPIVKIFENYFGLTSNKLEELEEKKFINEKNISELKSNIKHSESVLSLFDKEIDKNNFLPEEYDKYNQEISEYLNETDELNKIILSNNKRLVEKKKKEDELNGDIKELEKLKRITKKWFSEIEYNCTHCNSRLTRPQSLKRLKLSDNEQEINNLLLISRRELKIVSSEISDIRNSMEKLKNDYDEKSKKLKELNQISGIEDLVSNKFTEKLLKFMSKEKINLINTEKLIGDIQKDIDIETNKNTNKKNGLKIEYKNYKDKIESYLSDISKVNQKFLSFSKPKDKGTGKNQYMLTVYLIYSQLLSHYSNFMFPLTIDSFIKNETTDKNEIKMFKAVQKFFIELDTQTFFSIIDKNLKKIDITNSHTIVLSNRLLTKENYQTLQSEII